MRTPALKRLVTMLAIGSAFFLPLVATAKSTEGVAASRMADKAGPLPLKATFHKDAAAKTEGPYVLTLTNTSYATLKVSAKVDVSVAVHNRPKTREVGPQEIAPGKHWKIDDLAAEDKVTVSAEGYEPLKLTVK